MKPFSPLRGRLGVEISEPSASAHRNATVSATKWPPITLVPLLLLIVVKPIADAFYEEEMVKYLFMVTLIYASFLARCGQLLGGETWRTEPSKSAFLWLVIAYFVFLFWLTVTHGGRLQEIFKVVSPFIFFALTAFATSRWMAYALAGSAILVILANAALMPFDYGWTTWGAVRTFKGLYYFKTDLAYSLCFAILTVAIYSRYTVTPWLGLLVILAAGQIVLANSRLNYLTFFAVIAFIAIKSGVSWRALVRNSFLIAAVTGVALWLYDPSKLLGFDTSNTAAFTQGREAIWLRLVDSQMNSTIREWLFGHGMFADLLLAYEAPGRGEAHNAHNEFFHLIYTQGIIGTALYVILWIWVFRFIHKSSISPWLRGTGLAAFLFFSLQGMTAVVSSFASKTWPLVMVLLMIKATSDLDTRATAARRAAT